MKLLSLADRRRRSLPPTISARSAPSRRFTNPACASRTTSSVVGFDDIPDRRTVLSGADHRAPADPPDRPRGGQYAAGAIAGIEPASPQVILPTELILRASTAPCRTRACSTRAGRSALRCRLLTVFGAASRRTSASRRRSAARARFPATAARSRPATPHHHAVRGCSRGVRALDFLRRLTTASWCSS